MIKLHFCLSWIVRGGMWFGVSNQPHLGQRDLSKEDLTTMPVYGLHKELLEISGPCLHKAVLLHLQEFSIPNLQVLQSNCLKAVEVVSQIQKTTSMLWSAEQLWFLLWGHHPHLDDHLLCDTWQVSTLEIRLGSSIFANILAIHWLNNFLDALGQFLSLYKPINLQ